eukprot:gene336-360_t
MKRGRTDGHLNKEELAAIEEEEEAYHREITAKNEFVRATPNTLASRRIVTAQRKDKKEQFAKHLVSLNKNFYSWLREQIAADACVDLSDGFQDYVDYVSSLEDRYLRTYGEVLTFGSGDCGQLAHGIDEEEDLSVKFPRIVYSLRDKKVCGIACGGIHNAVYTESGQVYTWGCADDGSLGRPGEESMPLLVDSLVGETIIGLACGDGQTIAVSTSGDVWGWGCYKDKEGKKWFNPSADAAVPMKDIKKQQNTPIKISGLKNIVEVACGASFNLAKTADGVLYSWGIGECGELGRDSPALKVRKPDGEEDYDLPSILKHHITPSQMILDKSVVGLKTSFVCDVKAFGCGAYHSLIALVGDRVFACGLNNYGQLGTGDTKNQTLVFEIAALQDKGIVSLKGGMHHSLVLSSSGELYAFGRGDSGQLGSNEGNVKSAGDFCALPVKPLLPPNTLVASIDCGGNHNLALTRAGDVYSWGYGDMLALGHGEDKDEFLPKKLNFQKAGLKNITVTQVAGGGQHSAIIGKVVSV